MNTKKSKATMGKGDIRSRGKQNLNPEAKEFKPTNERCDLRELNRSTKETGTDKTGVEESKKGQGKEHGQPISHKSRQRSQQKGSKRQEKQVLEELEQKSKNSIATHSCVICANENAVYYAIGPCDHPICSLCSLRMRFKANDMTCSVCKQNMEFVVVFDARKGDRLFTSFGLTGCDSVIPGVDVEQKSRMLFVDSNDHYRELVDLRSVICPYVDCKERFPSEAALLLHLPKKHSGVTFCSLCLENRPLFIPEQMLYNAQALKRHMMTGPGNTGGHPLCYFCRIRFFDNSHLYKHMTREHCNCHLCPSQTQRYYVSAWSLHQHIKEEHILCEHCDAQVAFENGLEFGFRTMAELHRHLRQVHHISTNPDHSRVVRHGFRASFRPESDEAAGYVDMDFSSTDPNHLWRLIHEESDDSDGGKRGVGKKKVPQRRDSPSPQGAIPEQLVPPHMRIAGRVTGAGIFQRTGEDEALQAFADEANLARLAVAEVTAAATSWAARLGSGSRASLQPRPDNFPSLASQLTNTNPERNTNVEAAIERNKLRQAKLSLQPTGTSDASLEELEQRRAKRNAQLAEAFGVESSSSTDFASNIAIGLIRGLRRQENDFELSQVEGISKKEWELLRRPLFPAGLIQWARRNRSELLKLEKKMYDLIANSTETSVQLKPMAVAMREVVHRVAKYYGLNTYEYDREPNRYVSLVKNPDSAVPCAFLSVAAETSTPSLPPPLIEWRTTKIPSPFVFVTIHDLPKRELALINKEEVLESFQEPQESLTQSSTTTFTVAELLTMAKKAFDSIELTSIIPVGYSTVALEFNDLPNAMACFHALSSHEMIFSIAAPKSVNVKPSGIPPKSGVAKLKFVDLFELTASFDAEERPSVTPPKATTLTREGTVDQVTLPSHRSSSSFKPSAVPTEQPDSCVQLTEDLKQEWEELFPSGSPAATTGAVESSRDPNNRQANENKYFRDHVRSGEYKRLELKPRSEDLPPRLPPYQPPLKPASVPPQPAEQKKKKPAKNIVDKLSAEQPMSNSFALLNELSDEEEAVDTSAKSETIPSSNCDLASDLGLNWTCPVCTLINEIPESDLAGLNWLPMEDLAESCGWNICKACGSCRSTDEIFSHQVEHGELQRSSIEELAQAAHNEVPRELAKSSSDDWELV